MKELNKYAFKSFFKTSQVTIVSLSLLLIIACNSSLPTDKHVKATKTIAETVKTNINSPICLKTSEIEKMEESIIKNILEKISEIPEVNNLDSNERRFCYSERIKENEFYLVVQVFLEKETHFSGQFKFYINKKSQEIKIEDFVSNTLMSLEEYRKR